MRQRAIGNHVLFKHTILWRLSIEYVVKSKNTKGHTIYIRNRRSENELVGRFGRRGSSHFEAVPEAHYIAKAVLAANQVMSFMEVPLIQIMPLVLHSLWSKDLFDNY